MAVVGAFCYVPMMLPLVINLIHSNLFRKLKLLHVFLSIFSSYFPFF